MHPIMTLARLINLQIILIGSRIRYATKVYTAVFISIVHTNMIHTRTRRIEVLEAMK